MLITTKGGRLMPRLQLEERVALLEMEVTELKRQLKQGDEMRVPWWDQVAGTFVDDRLSKKQCAWAANIGRHSGRLTRKRTTTMFLLDTDHLTALERGNVESDRGHCISPSGNAPEPQSLRLRSSAATACRRLARVS